LPEKFALQIGHQSDPGRQRVRNEDSYLILTPPVLGEDIDAVLVVADGMGGHRAGDIASRALVTWLDEWFTSAAYRQDCAYSPQHPDYYIVVLKEALERANEYLCNLAATHTEWNNLGTTGTAVLIARGHLFWGHVGDSRAYLLRNGHLQQLTQDHTWVAEQMATGQISPREAREHPRRHLLTQSLGTPNPVRVDRGMHDTQPGDVILLCSDGLSSLVSEEEIRGILLSESDPQEACYRLVNLANDRGGPDNTTVIIARLEPHNRGNRAAIGRLIGPVSRPTPPQPSQPVPSRTEQAPQQRISRYLHWLLKSGVTLLLGAGLVGLTALFLSLLLPEPVFVVWTAVGSFIVGALLGWLLSPTSSGTRQRALRQPFHKQSGGSK
jgi:serine/threonine protein phosphatase PrpC